MSRGDHDDWRLPVLDRMRTDVQRAAERDAASLGRRRRHAPLRRMAALAAASLAIAGLAALFLGRSDEDAIADVRDAPRAAERRGTFAFRSAYVVTTSAGAVVRTTQAGVVDLRASAFAARTLVRGRRGAERRGVGGTLYFRGVDASGRWRRAGGGDLPASVTPVSASGLRALADARGERLVAERESVAGVAVAHLRLRMPAATFLRLRRGSPEDRRLRGVTGVVDVWLDEDDLPRRVTAAFTEGDRAFRIDSRYSEYGTAGSVPAPAESSPADGGKAVAVADPAVASMVAVFGS